MKKRLWSVFMAFCLMLTLLPAGALAAEDSEAPVSAVTAGDAESLKSAIASAKDGDTIEIPSGTYEIGSLTVTKAISLQGAGADETILVGVLKIAGSENDPGSDPTSTSISVSGITFRPAQDADSVNFGLYFGNGWNTNAYMTNWNITVSNCAFEDWQYAICLQGGTLDSGSTSGNTLTVTGCTFDGVFCATSVCATSGTLDMAASDFEASGPYYYAAQVFGDEDGQHNYYYSTLTSDPVDVTIDSDNGRPAEGFQGFSVIVLDESGTPKSYADTVSGAVTAADDGDTIYLPAGEYEIGSLNNITKAVNIQGEGAGETILTGTMMYQNLTDGGGTNKSITIEGITLNAPSGENANHQGLCWSTGVSGYQLNVTGCEFNGWQYAIGINSGASSNTLNVSNTSFNDTFCAMSVKEGDNNNSVSVDTASVTTTEGLFAVQKFGSTTNENNYYYNAEDAAKNENAVPGSEIGTVPSIWEAKSGNTYGSLKDLVEAAASAEAPVTIELLSDIALEESITIPAKDITIHGSNHSITYPVSASAAFTIPSGAEGNSLTVQGVSFVVSDVEETPVTGFGILVGEATDGVSVTVADCSFANLYSGVYFGHLETGATGSLSITNSTYTNCVYGYSVDEVTNGSAVNAVEPTFTGNTGDVTESESWDSITVTHAGSVTAYGSWDAAYAAAQTGDTITLYMDVETEALQIEKQITLDGNGHTIRYSGSATAEAPANGALITVQGDSADSVEIKNLTVETDGKVKHGVQFYCVEGGALTNVTINGGAYTSVNVNGSQVTMTDCTLKPSESAYANIEYGMGSGVTEIPEITLSNVTGNPDKPLVYADKATADAVKANDSTIDSSATAADIAAAINETYLTGAQITLVYSEGDGDPTVIPGTEIYTITLDANGGSFAAGAPTSATTNNENQLDLDALSVPTREGYTFAGWFTEASGGTQITAETTFSGNDTLYAHWSSNSSGYIPGGSGSTTYAITIEGSDCGTVTSNRTSAASGVTVTLTVTPDEGYELDTLTVTDRDGDTITLTNKGDGTYTFTMPASRVTVTATFQAVTDEPADTGLPFTDVAASVWYYDAVQYVYGQGMMNGTSASTFSPLMTTDRAMIVTILYRLEGEPAVTGTSAFSDVADGQWYTDAVIWAADNGIVTGYDTGAFGPSDTVTREQMAAILYRYASYKGYDVTASADLSGYADQAQISGYALTAMQWANAESLITGTSDSTLTPGGSATRAEAATILMRFAQSVAN